MATELAEQKKEVREEIKIINMKFMGRLPALTLSIVFFCFVFSKAGSSQSPEVLALLAIHLSLLTLLGEVLFET